VDVVTPALRVLNDRYQIEGFLGSGGMATVWRAWDLRLERWVALKELSGAWLNDAYALGNFEREARTAAGLAHPNIVAVYDVGVDGDCRYLVMELVDGATVAQLVADGPLTVVSVVAIAAQTCDGLAAAHAAGVIHRDIKPANLIVTPSGVVKICDFGIARALPVGPDSGLTQPTVAIGTGSYMAPEQARGAPLDARADLYALGATMFTMLAGAPPFQGNQAQILEQHLNQTPAPLREHRADVSPPLEALVARLLAKSPVDRPASATEVKEWLAGMMLDPSGAAVSMPARGMIPVQNTAVSHKIRSAGQPPSANDRTSRLAPHYQAHRLRGILATATLVIVLVLTATAVTWAIARRSVPSGLLNAPTTTNPPTTAPVATAQQTSAVAQPPIPSQPSQPTTAPTTTPSPATQTPGDPIAVIRMSILRLVSTGDLDPDKASDLNNNVDAIAHAMNQGNAGDVTNNIKAMRDKLTSLRTGGQLTASGYDELNRDLDAIAAQT
jgi:serine/threonine-protein kinase